MAYFACKSAGSRSLCQQRANSARRPVIKSRNAHLTARFIDQLPPTNRMQFDVTEKLTSIRAEDPREYSVDVFQMIRKVELLFNFFGGQRSHYVCIGLEQVKQG